MTREQDVIIERMGRHFETEGVPRIGGRLYGFLLLQGEPRSLDELAAGLRVSKTSVSSNARLLEATKLIERVTKPGDRRDYYQATSDQTLTLEFRLQHIQEMGRLLKDALQVLPEGDTVVERRLSLMDDFNSEALQILQDLLDTWHARKPAD